MFKIINQIIPAATLIIFGLIIILNVKFKRANKKVERKKYYKIFKNTPIEQNNDTKIIEIKEGKKNNIINTCFVLRKNGHEYKIIDDTGSIDIKLINENITNKPLEGRFARIKITKKYGEYYGSVLTYYEEVEKVKYDFNGDTNELCVTRMFLNFKN